MKEEKVLLPKESLIKLKKVLKQYRNLYKTLYLVNPAAAEEFMRKQEAYFRDKTWSSEHLKLYPNCKKEFKPNTKLYIKKENMNTYEKQLFDIYSSLFTQDNLNKLLLFLEDKYSKIIKRGEEQGFTMNDKKEETDLLHKILLEGVPFYLSSLLKQKLKDYENSISEQPALVANPYNVKDKRMINFLSGDNLKEIVNNLYTVIDKNIYENIDIEPYNMYNQFKYLYDEGLFEQKVNDENRTDFIFNFNAKYFEDSKHKLICSLTEAICSMPYELNMKYSSFQLQINDYIQGSFFRPNFSEIKKTMDSSLSYDTGKKLTFLIVLFPNEASLSDRFVDINLYEQKNNETSKDEIEKSKKTIKLTKPLSGIIFKTRKIIYEIPKVKIPFVLITFYIHGPKDPNNNF